MSTLDWRRIAPVDCVGCPDIAVRYQRELLALAADQGIQVAAGQTVTAQYRQVAGLWWPIPESLAVS